MSAIKVKGSAQLIRRLRALPRPLRNKILRPAVTAASRQVQRAAKANARAASTSQTGTRELERSIDFKVKSTKRSVYGAIGPRWDRVGQRVNIFGKIVVYRPAKTAHLFEGGSQPRVIMIGRGRKTPWQHPGTPATKFMERAWNATAPQAQRTIETKVREGLKKYA